MSFDISDLRRRMDGAIESLSGDLSSLRTGRATTSMLDPVVVDAYGSNMPLNQCATVSVPEPRLLSVQVWDKGLVKNVEKAIRDAGLGLNPQNDGQAIRVPIPELNTERRTELTKVAGKYAEATRVAIRNVRRDGMDTLKKLEKEKTINEDDHKRFSDEVQKLTDNYVAQVDKKLADKEKDIMTV
jgi:ribosome recycling factor